MNVSLMTIADYIQDYDGVGVSSSSVTHLKITGICTFVLIKRTYIL
jgi:hypothetical protein